MTNKYYQLPRPSNIKLHGDFRYTFPNATASAVKIINMQIGSYPPVVTCIKPDEWKEITGIEHTDETYIRSWLLLFRSGLTFDTKVLDWISDNAQCKQAYEANETYPDYIMSHDYGALPVESFIQSDTAHFEFDIPDEMLIMVPVNLNDAWFDMIPPEVQAELVNMMAWSYLMSTLPITNIRIVKD